MTTEKIIKNIQMAVALGYPLSDEETKFLDAALAAAASDSYCLPKEDNAERSAHVFIRARITGTLPSGQKRVQLLANNADGITFYTNDESIVSISQMREWSEKH